MIVFQASVQFFVEQDQVPISEAMLDKCVVQRGVHAAENGFTLSSPINSTALLLNNTLIITSKVLAHLLKYRNLYAGTALILLF